MTTDATHVSFVAWDGAELAVDSPSAHPPGARIAVSVVPDGRGDTDQDAWSLRMKVHRCRRRGDDRFVVIGRPLDLRRDVREALEAFSRASATGRGIDRW